MRVIIIGAGITGLTTAYYLLRDGHTVTIVDANAGPGEGASFANGGQLSYSYVAPLAGPGVLPKVPPWLLRRDAPLRFSPKFDPDQWRWLIQFVLACTRERSNLTTRRLLALSFHSRNLMHAFIQSPLGRSFEFGYATNGKLVVYSDREDFEGAKSRLDYQRSLGCEQAALDVDACRALEPALADPQAGLVQRMVGAIYTPSEEVGDCYQFCVALERHLTQSGVSVRYGHRVLELMRNRSAITGILTDHGTLEADAVVLASGTASAALARPLGLYLPVYPLKGYSITVPGGDRAPAISITDFKKKVVYAPLRAPGNGAPRVRIAGMADIVGHDPRIDPVRLEQLILEARTALPHASANDYAKSGMDTWAGLRPATPRGTPILGATPVPGLFVNIGQGALGWTLSLGSGHVLADVIAARTPAISLDGMSLATPG
jgi:D-amino-acid dehydrogenase